MSGEYFYTMSACEYIRSGDYTMLLQSKTVTMNDDCTWSSAVGILLILSAVYAVIYFDFPNWYRKKRHVMKCVAHLPGPPALPVFGSALHFLMTEHQQLFEKVERLIQPYAKDLPVRVWLGHKLYVALINPVDVEVIINSEYARLKGECYKLTTPRVPFIKDGLLFGCDQPWKNFHKMALRTMNTQNLTNYVRDFDAHSKIFVQEMKCMADRSEFDITDSLQNCIIDACIGPVLGRAPTYAQIRYSPLANRIKRISNMFVTGYERVAKVWLHPECIFRLSSIGKEFYEASRICHELIKECVQLRNAETRATEESKRSIFEQLLEMKDSNPDYVDEQLATQAVVIYVAAEDTLTAACVIVLLTLATYPEVQEKVREETRKVFDGEVSMAHLQRLKYLDMVIKETFRLFPPIPAITRTLEEDVELRSCTLPKGCQILLSMFTLHRNAEYWEDPERFDPDRFLPEKRNGRHPYAYIPFGGGPMSCIGQKFAMALVKTVIARLLLHYRIKSKRRIEDTPLKADVSLRPVHGCKISLESL